MEQLRLDAEVPVEPSYRLPKAICWRGLRGVAECRVILAEKSLDSPSRPGDTLHEIGD